MQSKNFFIRALGKSYDNRTNKWEFTCKICGKVFNPPTTIMAVQTISCPASKCNNYEIINYNKLE